MSTSDPDSASVAAACVALALYSLASVFLLVNTSRGGSWRLNKLVTDAFSSRMTGKFILASELATTVTMFAALLSPPAAEAPVMWLLVAAYGALAIWLWFATKRVLVQVSWQVQTVKNWLLAMYFVFASLFVTAGIVYSASLDSRPRLASKHVLVWLHVAHRVILDGTYTVKMWKLNLNPAAAEAVIIMDQNS